MATPSESKLTWLNADKDVLRSTENSERSLLANGGENGSIVAGNNDEKEENWITVENGEHVLLGEGGEIKAGLGGKFADMKPSEAWGEKQGENESATFNDPGKKEERKSVDPGRKQHAASIKRTLKHAEDEIRNLSHERAYVIDRQGNTVSVMDGTDKDVEVAGNIKGLTVTHNHPSGSTFSRTDIFAFVDRQPYEVRVATPQGTTYSLKLKDNIADPRMKDDFAKAKPDDHMAPRRIILELAQRGKYTRHYAEKNMDKLVREYMHERTRKWLSENAEKYGCIYTEEG